MGCLRTIVALVAAGGVGVACAAAEESALGDGAGGEAAGGADGGAGGSGAGGDATGGGGSGAIPGLRIAFSAGGGDLVPGTRIDAWLEKEGLRIEEGVTWTLEPAVGIGDRMGRVATGIGLGGCAACVRLGGVALTGPSLPANDFARFRLEATLDGALVSGEVRLHPVHAASATTDGRALAGSTRLEGGRLGDRGLDGPGTLFFAAGASVDEDGFAPLEASLFVPHAGELTRLEDRGAFGGKVLAVGLVEGGASLLSLRADGERGLVGVAREASELGLEKIEAATSIVAGGCGEFLAVASNGKGFTIDPELSVATEASVGGLAQGAIARRIFSGEGRDAFVFAFVLGDDGAIHPFASDAVCPAEMAGDAGHSCVSEYTNRTTGRLADAVHVAGHLYARSTDRETYLGQGTDVCTETAAGAVERANCRTEPGPLAAGKAWAWEANGACGFSGMQLEEGATTLSTVAACEVCGFGMNEAGEPKGGAPLDVRSVGALIAADGTERLVVAGAPEQGLRIVVRDPKGDCPVTCP